MDRARIMKKTENILKRAPEMKKKIKEYREKTEIIDTSRKLRNTEYELKRLLDNLKELNIDEQKIIVYRYFENMNYKQIAPLFNYSISSAQRKLDKAVLELGRVIFGMEKEFWDQFK